MDADGLQQPKTAGNPPQSEQLRVVDRPDPSNRADVDLRLVADSAHDLAMVFTDADGTVVRWSPGAEHVTGWTEAEVIGRNERDLIYTPDDQAAGVPQQEQGNAERAGRAEAERWYVRKDGARFWGVGVMTPLYDQNTGVLRGFGKVLRDMTRQKRLEDELRGLFEESLDAVLIVGDAASLLSSNSTDSALGGSDGQSVVGRRVFELLPADDTGDAAARWRDFLSRGEQEGTVRIVRPDGSTMEARYQTRSEYVADRHLPALRHVTKRRRAEQALRASEARLAAIFARAAVGLSEIGLDGRFLQVNDELCRILGRSREELLETVVPQVTHPEDVPRSLEALAQTVETGGPVSFDKRYLRPDGAEVWANSSLTLLRDSRGDPRAVLAVTVDLSERKRQEDQLRALFEESLDALLIAGDDAVLVDANPAAGDLFDMDRKDIVGQRIFDLFPPETRDGAERLWADFLSQGHQEGMLRLVRRNGHPVEVEYRARAHYVQGRHLSVLRDVTTRWHAEQALRASEQALREANETLESRVEERTRVLRERTAQLQAQTAELGRMSEMRHDLLQRLVTTEEQERRRISRELHDQSGQHLTGLALGLKSLEDILRTYCPPTVGAETLLTHLRGITDELSRDIHRMAVELRPTALDDLGLVPALQSHVERWSQSLGVPTEFDTFGLSGDDSRLPETVETTIYRVVQEALTNVAKYACDGPHRATHVSITLQRFGGQLMASVEDDGPGFDTEAVSQSGRLGVAGMQERAASCGGTLEIESIPGKGTTVFIRVPVEIA